MKSIPIANSEEDCLVTLGSTLTHFEDEPEICDRSQAVVPSSLAQLVYMVAHEFSGINLPSLGNKVECKFLLWIELSKDFCRFIDPSASTQQISRTSPMASVRTRKSSCTAVTGLLITGYRLERRLSHGLVKGDHWFPQETCRCDLNT
jgi:hypothetical protein